MQYNMKPCKSSDGFRDYGEALVANGFEVIPVRYKSKVPAVDKDVDWRKLNLGIDDVRQINKKQRPTKPQGVGIVTGKVCTIDIDVYSQETASKMLDEIAKLLGMPIKSLVIRQGEAPKLMLIFKTVDGEHEFSKRNTGGFVHWEDEDPDLIHRVETQSSGQYFILAGTHPCGDKFKLNVNPNVLTLDSLPEITESEVDTVIELAKETFNKLGYVPKAPKTRTEVARTANKQDDEEFLESLSERPVNYSYDQLVDMLSVVQDMSEEYETWVQVGQVLHHAEKYQPHVFTDDTGTAFDLFVDWSEQATSFSSEKDCAKKWKSFHADRSVTQTLTVRSLFKWVRERKTEELIEEAESLEQRIKQCRSIHELTDKILPETAKILVENQANVLMRETMAKMIVNQSGVIDKEKKFSLATVKKLLNEYCFGLNDIIELPDDRKLTQSEINSMPEFGWCKEWVYLSSGDSFYNIETKGDPISQQSFNHQYAKVLTPAGALQPVVQPSQFMSAVYGIDVVSRVIIDPRTTEPFIDFKGQTCANCFVPSKVKPAPRKKWTAKQREWIETFERHVLTVCGGNQKDAHILMEYLATSCLTPEKRLQWFVLAIGPEGSGKSIFMYMAMLLLGDRHVHKVGSDEITKSRFLDWAVNKLLVNIEELKASGQNRIETQNKLKDLSNPIITIEPKGSASFNIPNYTSVIANSNYHDAVKVDRGDRRWFIVSSSHKNEVELSRFMDEYPEHYPTLYNGLWGVEGFDKDDIAAALFTLFQEYLDSPSDEFAQAIKRQRAPMTQTKQSMIEVESDSLADELLEIIDAGTAPFLTESCVSVTELAELIEYGKLSSAEFKSKDDKNAFGKRRAGLLLSKSPFYFTDNQRVSICGRKHSLWFKYPSSVKTVEDRKAFIDRHVERIRAQSDLSVFNGGDSGLGDLADEEFTTEPQKSNPKQTNEEWLQ